LRNSSRITRSPRSPLNLPKKRHQYLPPPVRRRRRIKKIEVVLTFLQGVIKNGLELQLPTMKVV
jgi:hypothetical protein